MEETNHDAVAEQRLDDPDAEDPVEEDARPVSKAPPNRRRKRPLYANGGSSEAGGTLFRRVSDAGRVFGGFIKHLLRHKNGAMEFNVAPSRDKEWTEADEFRKMFINTMGDEIGTLPQTVGPWFLFSGTPVIDYDFDFRGFTEGCIEQGIDVFLPTRLDIVESARRAVLFINGPPERRKRIVESIQPFFERLITVPGNWEDEGLKMHLWVEVYPREEIIPHAEHLGRPGVQKALKRMEEMNRGPRT